MENYIGRTLRHLCRVPIDKLIQRRYQKLRLIGSLSDGSIRLTGEARSKKNAKKKRATPKAKISKS